MNIKKTDTLENAMYKAQTLYTMTKNTKEVSKETYRKVKSDIDSSLSVINESLASGYFLGSNLRKIRDTKSILCDTMQLLEKIAIASYKKGGA